MRITLHAAEPPSSQGPAFFPAGEGSLTAQVPGARTPTDRPVTLPHPGK